MQAPIIPVQVFPGEANRLFVQNTWSNSLGGAPMFYYQLQYLAPGSKVAEILKDGNVAMTSTQWNNWAVGGNDEAYILSCLAENLGLELDVTT